jgi:hypothetical protein
MADSKELQKWIKSNKETNRAKTSDKILVVIVNVKGELKNEFDIWVKDVLYDALYKSKSEMKKAQLKTVRWLEPVRQNRDSTWTYSWIMDPIIPNTDYDILTFLEKEYGKELGQKHWDKYLTFMASEPSLVTLKQTNY